MNNQFRYPRRVLVRKMAKYLAAGVFSLLCDFRVEGKEHFPERGPLLVVANHFSFIDPVAVIRTVPWPLEYMGGAEFPHAPPVVQLLPRLYGYFPVFRGTGSRDSLRAAEAILEQDGVLGIMPEGGSWAEVLRPARPGTAYLAARTGAKILPLALTGFNDIFPLKIGKRPPVQVRIGPPIGPFSVNGKGRERREKLDQIGEEIMLSIADLLPDRFRGYLADDPAVRRAAEGTEIYPWEDKVEGEVEGEIH